MPTHYDEDRLDSVAPPASGGPRGGKRPPPRAAWMANLPGYNPNAPPPGYALESAARNVLGGGASAGAEDRLGSVAAQPASGGGDEQSFGRLLGSTIRQTGQQVADTARAGARAVNEGVVQPLAYQGQEFAAGLTGQPAQVAADADAAPGDQGDAASPPPSIARRPAQEGLFGVPLGYGGGGAAAPAGGGEQPGAAGASGPTQLSARDLADRLAGVEATAGNARPIEGLGGQAYAGNYGRTPVFRRDTTNPAGESLAEFTDLQGLQRGGQITGDAAELAAAEEVLADVNPQRTAQTVPAGSLAAVPGGTGAALSQARQAALARGDVEAAERSLMTSAERERADLAAAARKQDPVGVYKTDTLAAVEAQDRSARQARQQFEDERAARRDLRAESTARRRAVADRESGVVDAVQLAERLGGNDIALGSLAAQLVPYLAEGQEDVSSTDLAQTALDQARRYRAAGYSSLDDVLDAGVVGRRSGEQ